MGFITEPNMFYSDETPGDIKAEYDVTGTVVNSRFTPKPGALYKIAFEVYKGFDSNERNLARRLFGPGYYKVVRLRLNLKRYVDEGYTVSGSPKLSVDYKYQKSASNDHFGTTIERTTIAPGVWQWEINKIRNGVLRLTWDVCRH